MPEVHDARTRAKRGSPQSERPLDRARSDRPGGSGIAGRGFDTRNRRDQNPKWTISVAHSEPFTSIWDTPQAIGAVEGLAKSIWIPKYTPKSPE